MVFLVEVYAPNEHLLQESLSKMDDSESSLLDDVNEAFRKFDRNQDGYLEPCDVREMLDLMDLRMTSLEFQEFFSYGDINATGKISLSGL